MERKLYRSRKNQMIAGVCGGVAEYLDIDPTVIRVLFAILAVFAGGGVLLYLVLMIVIPLSPEGASQATEVSIAKPESAVEPAVAVDAEETTEKQTEPQE